MLRVVESKSLGATERGAGKRCCRRGCGAEFDRTRVRNGDIATGRLRCHYDLPAVCLELARIVERAANVECAKLPGAHCSHIRNSPRAGINHERSVGGINRKRRDMAE